ncbi:hypothetical protein [Cellulomonas cellasea]|uniref:Phosphomannomutase n=1 Tax=Cellulomonas cellasea TaxID=43670 RepID=A0A7W4UEV6_9CELL|nr:hypothetical protein [Cellulomonas cellasea]MBB2922918.1 phosphomannomutase [Cellulomonas cellasea]
MPEPQENDRPTPDDATAATPRTGADAGVRPSDVVGLAPARPVTVVLDAAHGGAGRAVRDALGDDPGGALHLVLVHADDAPRDAPAVADDGPLATGLVTRADAAAATADLRAAVLEHGADLGLALDPTGCALTVLDEAGQPVDEGVVAVLVGLRLVARELAAGRAPTLVHDVLASRVLDDLVGGAGAELVRTRVGLPALADAVAEHGAVLGVGHGGVFVVGGAGGAGETPDAAGARSGGDGAPVASGLVAGLHVVAALADQPHPMSVLAELYQPYVSTGVLVVDVADAAAATERVHDAYVARQGAGPVVADELDGLTVAHWDATPQWWFSVRASGSGDRVGLLVEAADEDIVEKVRDDVLALVREDR